MAYTPLLNPTTISLTGVTGSTWTTRATGVPAGATGVKLLLVLTATAAASARGVRMGPAGGASTDTYATAIGVPGSVGGFPVAHEWNIGVDSSQQIQYYSASATPTEGTLYVLGYYGSESVFFLNAISISALTTSFATYSCSAAIPGSGIAGFFFITGGDYDSLITTNGSSDAFANTNESNIIRHWLVGCDASQNIRGKSFHSGTLLCQGYMTAGLTWHQNAVAVTPGTAGSFQNVAQAGSDTGTIAANQYYVNITSGALNFQLSGQTASTIPVAHIPCSENAGQYSAFAPSQANLSTLTNVTLYELGYFTSGGGASGQYGMLMGVGQ